MIQGDIREAHTHTHAHNSDSSRLSGPRSAARRHQSQDPYTHTSPVKHTHTLGCTPKYTGHLRQHTHTDTCTQSLTHNNTDTCTHTPPEQYFNWKCWRLKNFSFISQCCNWIWDMPACARVCTWVCVRERVCARAPCVCSADSGVSIDSNSKTEMCVFFSSARILSVLPGLTISPRSSLGVNAAFQYKFKLKQFSSPALFFPKLMI